VNPDLINWMKKLYFNVGFAILDEKPGGENEE
jgi:hypothetical protein